MILYPRNETVTLAKGNACIQCRKHKVKCDGSKPVCSRCRHTRKACIFPGGVVRRQGVRRTEILVARALELETKLNKLTASMTHNLSLASARLRERIERLGKVSHRQQRDAVWLPIYLNLDTNILEAEDSKQGSAIPFKAIENGEPLLIRRTVIERTLDSYHWTMGEEVPPLMSYYLISLFLPHRTQFHFFMDVSWFLYCLSLPPSHPQSTHPCLRYACYLGACTMVGGQLATNEPYFVERTRHFLNEALMYADRITHYLWASMILGSYFARTRRVEESFALVASAARFASAAGLVRRATMGKESDVLPTEMLLPMPSDGSEALDRVWLFHSVYVTDQVVGTLTATPGNFICDERWEPTRVSEQKSARYPWLQVPMTTQEELQKIWQSDVHLNASVIQVFERVSAFARSNSTDAKNEEEKYTSLCFQFRFHDTRIPPLSKSADAHTLLAHMTLYGSGMLLYGTRARLDPKARREMLRCVQALMDTCDKIRKEKSAIHSLLPMVHMMNVTRIIAQELRGSEARKNANLSAEYYRSIESILDFLDDMTVDYPAWVNVPILLKDTLATATEKINLTAS